jgi:sulfite exporter TauE/SafE
LTPDTEKSVTDDREAIQSNVRRIVGIAALRRIHRMISGREEEQRMLRTVIAPIAAIVMIVIAVLIWHFASPWADDALAPLPECAPPRGEMISI